MRIPPAFVLAIDPDTVDVAVRIFERYSVGTLSIEDSESSIQGMTSVQSGVRRRAHSSSVYEPWIIGQVTGIRVDESTVERIVRVLSAPEARPIDVNRARLDRMKHELALDHAAGRMDDKAYLAQIAVLRDEATRIDSSERPGNGIAPDKIVAKLRALPETWATATPAGRSELLHSISERIIVRGPEFVSARLTPEA